ncbi:MAG: hypothetical protein FJY91_02665 [Candidatus Harrisonbacteria bacterium]|nr:hypothetical protein [Candidatus Harrisonbacteria bacterium]
MHILTEILRFVININSTRSGMKPVVEISERSPKRLILRGFNISGRALQPWDVNAPLGKNRVSVRAGLLDA